MYDFLVKIVTPEMRVPSGCFYFYGVITYFKHGDIKRAAAKIVYHNFFILFLIKPIRERGRGWFVDDAFYGKPRDFSGVFGGLALGIVKIGGHGDDGLCYFFSYLFFLVIFLFFYY